MTSRPCVCAPSRAVACARRGMSFYRHKLTRRDELAYDQLGLALLECSRGTNDVESIHKQITTTLGEWCTGVQMADALLAEVCALGVVS